MKRKGKETLTLSVITAKQITLMLRLLEFVILN